MCNADLTIEWAVVEEDGTRSQVDGWDIPHRQCKSPTAVKEWMDMHHPPIRPNHTPELPAKPLRRFCRLAGAGLDSSDGPRTVALLHAPAERNDRDPE